MYEEDCAKKGLSVKIRNAEPYREFQNVEDNDRCDPARTVKLRFLRYHGRIGHSCVRV